jgi:type I restriction enzyme S subunit
MNKVCIPKLRFSGFDGEWENSVLNKFASLNPKNLSLPESFVYIDLESVTDGHLIKENVISRNDAPSRAQRVLKPKDILYQTVRPYQKNNLYFIKVGDYVASTGYAQIRTKNDAQFLFQFLHTEKFVANVMLRCTGTSYPAINSTDLSSIEISFPSLPEQQKIASFLSSVDEKIQQLSRKKELLEQYKKGVMQQLFSRKLRFKDKNGEEYPDWEEKKLGEIAKRVVRKNKENNLNVLTISAQLGLVSQLEYFNKSVSAKNVTNYYLLERNEFAYNKSYSNGYPMGAIKRLKKYDKGVVSTLYICFCFNTIVSLDFMEQYFEFGLHNKEIEKVAQEGARNHGLLNIGVNDFLNIELIIPSLPEQQKIANFLSGIDAKIEKTHQEINNMQGFKKGLFQQMFV